MTPQNNIQLTLDLIKTMFERIAGESDATILTYIIKDQDGNLAHLVTESPSGCVFELKFNRETFRDLVHPTYLVRLATNPGEDLTPCGDITQAAEKQYQAREKCPEMVQKVLGCGVAEGLGPQGEDIGYLFTTYPDGAIPFNQEMWEGLGPVDQGALMDSIVQTMGKYQMLGPPDDTINPSTVSADWDYLPHLGPAKEHVTMRDFLVGLVEASPRPDDDVVRVVDTDGGGLEVVLEHGENGSVLGLHLQVEFTAKELEQVHGYAVICHNDIEPENIMVREEVDPATGAKQFALAAIINWDKAGVYPFAYEFALRDFLFRPDRSFSWYRLFKSKTAAALLPDELSTAKFIRAVWLILHAKCKGGQMGPELAGRMGETWVGKYLGAKVLLAIGERRGWLAE